MQLFLRSICLGFVAAVATVATAEDTVEPVEFGRDVRSILSDKCYNCHGPDGNARETDLRLDQEQSARAEHDGGFPIVAGDLAKSQLYQRIIATDDERMPPEEFGRPLSKQEIDILRRWIEQPLAFGGSGPE